MSQHICIWLLISLAATDLLRTEWDVLFLVSPLLGLGTITGTHWFTKTMHSLITTLLLDMDVRINGEGRELVPGQENIEHLICATKQQPPYIRWRMSSSPVPFRFRQVCLCQCTFEKKDQINDTQCVLVHHLVGRTAGGKPVICPFFVLTTRNQLFFFCFFLFVFLPPPLPPPLPYPPCQPLSCSLPPSLFLFFDVFAFTASERSLIPSGHNREGGAVRKSISICAN